VAWEQPIVESAVDALEKRAEALASALTTHGRKREADVLRRLLALLERVDDLHRHAGDLETLTRLYRALAVFAHESTIPPRRTPSYGPRRALSATTFRRSVMVQRFARPLRSATARSAWW
jgi:hypothetical protein